MRVRKKRASAGSRTGFVLASIHTGAAIHLWTALAREVRKTDTAFFIFPGGRLSAQTDYEYLRNSVYRLVNAENLDNLISWGSSLGGTACAEELTEFHRSFGRLPFVTIAHKMPGHPCVRFDAYTGMKSLVRHFTDVHGSRKIAFLRGPENHVSSADRFDAYRDALCEASIPLDLRLVSSPFDWNDGENAVKELCVKRALVPGTDFDTLIASSDLLALPAVRYLQNMGVSVPHTVRAGGFNDSAESRILSSPLSTVRMPYAELGVTAFSLLSDAHTDCERVLPASIVIRQSCGCASLRGLSLAVPADETAAIPEKATSGAEIAALNTVHDDFQSVCERISGIFETAGVSVCAEPVLQALREQDTELFFNLAESDLASFFARNTDLSVFFEAASVLYASSCFSAEYVRRLEGRFFALLFQVQSRELAQKQYQADRTRDVLNSLKCGLLTTRSRDGLIEQLAAFLPPAGIDRAAVILFENDDFSLCLGGFSAGDSGTQIIFPKNTRFPARLLFPKEYEDYFQSGIFMVQPLFMENQPLGAFICSAPGTDGVLYEELRSAISSSLKGIFLFEEVSLAKQRAEDAERAQTAFFAHIGTNLSDPLAEITVKIGQIEQAVQSGVTDSDLLLPQLVFLKSAVREQLSKTNLLIDVTLSQIHELPLDKRVFSVGESLPPVFARNAGSASFPLLYGDPLRLKQALDLLCDHFTPRAENPLYFDGENFYFAFTPKGNPDAALWKTPELILTEQIILLQYGELRKCGENAVEGCTLAFPLPNLACLPPVRLSEGSSPLEFFADSVGAEDWAKLHSLRATSQFRIPVRFFASRFGSLTFMEEIEAHLRYERPKIFLFVGEKAQYPLWTDHAQIVRAASIDEFDASADCEPSLVVLDRIDCAALQRIRKNTRTVLTPVIVLPEEISGSEDISRLCSFPRVVLCNRAVAQSQEFAARVRSLVSGEDVLPPYTGALVKKAVLYLNQHADSQITRWKMADSINVSEDYLTRIFHKEIGLSPWEYLNRCRIFNSCELLLHTDKTLYEIAAETGFQDQAYFCRVFKKITGMPPGHYRDPKKRANK